ncbi:MAG: hypothetical protein HOA75_15830 [Deltaproteobacteria bacterium]|nr:hypothetical protein [Deltaproteobacteria bacterium]
MKMGIIAMVFALFLTILVLTEILASTLWGYPIAAIAFGGAFAIFEARAGWCVIRAMGFKTPL